jgi:hypothetical protein
MGDEAVQYGDDHDLMSVSKTFWWPSFLLGPFSVAYCHLYLRSISFPAGFLSEVRMRQEEREDFFKTPGSCGIDWTLHQLMYSSEDPQETSGYVSEVID